MIEGLDGSGTTTQARLLHRRLLEKRPGSVLTCEPTDGPVGKLIRDVLSGKLYSASDRRVMLSEKSLCLLFAADRIEHSAEIEGCLEAGDIVVCDRYILSSLAYQTLDQEIEFRWVVDVNRGCSIPDLTVFLAVPADICARRLRNRRDARTVYENRKVLRAIEENYERMLDPYAGLFGRLEIVDGRLDPDSVHERIWRSIEPVIG